MENEQEPYIRFRLGNLDSYQGKPTDLDRSEFSKVPIIRIWGAVEDSGQKVSSPSLHCRSRPSLTGQVCCHVHGVYPYCYIEYTGNLTPDEGIPFLTQSGSNLQWMPQFRNCTSPLITPWPSLIAEILTIQRTTPMSPG